MQKEKLTKAALPDAPGVYFFLDARKKVLYIGKATSLKHRVRSYFGSGLASTRSPLIVDMVEKAASLDFRQTDSVLEALILEANLIKHYKPHYNTIAKDDKSFNYVVVTREDFPRVLLVRGKVLDAEFPPKTRAYTFGPFPHGLQLKEALKLVRKIFPYRDVCVPCEEQRKIQNSKLKTHRGSTSVKASKCKGCFNASIGLCPGVCSGKIGKAEYRRIVRHIVLLFEGKKKELIKELGREMKAAVKEEAFEEATVYKRQIFALGHIQDVSLIKDEYRSPRGGTVMRIEAYDMAHLQGGANVGVMTVVEGGLAAPAEYRKFKIRSASPGDDIGALKEVLSRRLGHEEWPLPRLIIVDGSTAQMNAARAVLGEFGMMLPVVGVVKDEKHRPREIKGLRELAGVPGREVSEQDILLANSEAHRFAIGYHRKRSRKETGLT